MMKLEVLLQQVLTVVVAVWRSHDGVDVVEEGVSPVMEMPLMGLNSMSTTGLCSL